MEQLPQLQPCSFQRVRVMAPVAPTRSNGHDRGVHEGDLRKVLENLRVFVILNAVTNGLKPNPRSGLAGGNRTRRIEEDTVARSAEPATASGGVHIVPTADSISGGPSVSAVVKDSRSTLRPIQETRLDALVDGRIVHHPFRSVAEPAVATGVAPEVTMGKGALRPIQETRLDALVDRRIVHHPFRSVAEPAVATGVAPEVTMGKGQRGPLLHGIKQHPMVDGAAPIALVERLGSGVLRVIMVLTLRLAA